MNRFVLAVLLLSSIGPAAIAQAPTPKPADPAPKPKDPHPPTVYRIPVVPPRTGFYKTGPVLVGADGYYPFDTSEYNLSGELGNARSTGTFVMVLPNGEVAHNPLPLDPAPYPIPVYRHRFFHRN